MDSMNDSEPPDFYTGAPLTPEDLAFRDVFISGLWEELQSQHLILSAPRRTGKTSVMDYLVAHPRDEWAPISVFVQDIAHPADFILLMLDLFQEKYPQRFRQIFTTSTQWIGKVLGKISDVDVQGFKITLREEDKNWQANWKAYGDEFFAQVRKGDDRLLLLVDEFPDMILNMRKHHPELVRPFLAWFRGHRLSPHPKDDRVRWLVCGSVNLSSTLDVLGCLDEINDLHDIPLPPLTRPEVLEFVRVMLAGRGVAFAKNVPAEVATTLGRPVPVFLQMVTQDLYRMWKREGQKLTAKHVERAFAELIVTSGARDKLQHFYSRIEQYYLPPKREAAYALLAKLSISTEPVSREALLAEFARILHESGDSAPAAKRKQLFNQLMRDLENDFYVIELDDGTFDFASGLIKQWWKKYYA
jgi:uncharacterized protein